MRKLVTLLVLVSLVFGALAAPAAAAAQTAPDLTGLASYFPADIPLYIGVRTDDAFIDELDSLISKVAAKVPQAAMGGSLRSLLDQSIGQALGKGATFETAFRPWLGDSAAIGVLSLDSAMQGNTSDVPVLFAASVTNRSEAESFVEKLIADQNLPLVKTTDGKFTVYSYGVATPEPSATADSTATSDMSMSMDSSSIPAIAVSDDALLIGKTRADLPLNSDYLALDKADGFDVVSQLPAPGYNAIVYANLGKTFQTLFSQAVAQMRSQGSDTAVFESLMPIYANYPTMAVGLTVLDGSALTVDLAQGPIDYSVFKDTPFGKLDFASLLNGPAVDLSFARHIPADAPFSIQGANLGNTIGYLLDAVGYGVEFGAKQYMTMNIGSSSAQLDKLPSFLKDIKAEDVRAFVDLAVAGLTGLNLEDDILTNINGDFALFGRFLPVGSDNFTYDTALVVKVTEAAAIQHIFDKIKTALDRYKANYTTEGDGVFVLPDVIRGFFPSSYPTDKLTDPAYDFLLGHNADVAAIGSRGAVEFSLGSTGTSLADDPAYQRAQKYFLDGAQSVWYVGGAPVTKLVKLASSALVSPGSSTGYQVQMAETALSLLDSASITTVMNDQGTVVRLVLSLNTETAPSVEATATAEMTAEAPVAATAEAAAIEATAEATP